MFLSVRPHETTRLLFEGFSWNYTFQYFSKICWENSSFINIRQEYRFIYMKTNVHFWTYLTQVFLEGEIFQTKICRLWSRAGYMTIWRMRIACWIPQATNTHSQYVTRIAFILQRWLLERAWMLHYVHTACLVYSYQSFNISQYAEWITWKYSRICLDLRKSIHIFWYNFLQNQEVHMAGNFTSNNGMVHVSHCH